ncbi:MAG: nucleotidyl transferase AbiEii/AbiGii toxin family protein, partial [bacterium]|nr:nucleotidyl transferase AbiEii/AbiGii toxin family protein [bacterium]
DLILSRVLVDLFLDPFISDHLLLRGGTALNKLFFKPAARYSEDIDLVQKEAGSIGKVMDAVKKLCNPILGQPRTKQKQNSVIFTYRMNSEIPPVIPLRLKIEINTREHFSVFERIKTSYRVQSTWFTGESAVNTYRLEELLATKFRALYQRNKGRDLFDIWLGIEKEGVDTKQIISAFKQYMAHQNLKVSAREFRNNLINKLENSDFINDLTPLKNSKIPYSLEEAYQVVDKNLIAHL